MKKTPWFFGRVEPVRAGEYEVYRADVGRSFPKRTRLMWDGYEWAHTVHSGGGVGSFAHMSEKNKWRGLAKKP
jgi:hypothetical protein